MKAQGSSTALDIVFYLALALLCTHEIDAATKGEWRLLPLLSALPDPSGFFWFVVLHIPLFTAIFWLTGHPKPNVARVSRICVSVFLIAHGGIHFALSGHEKYIFAPPLETITVYGGALAGLLYLGLLRLNRS